VPFMEGIPDYHNVALTPEQVAAALAALEPAGSASGGIA